jgi:hypothetical protein
VAGLILVQCDGDGVFALADKFVVVVAGLMGERHSCALHRDAFAVTRDIDPLGWNAVKLRERALDSFAVDVGLIDSQVTACGRGSRW